MREEGRAGTRAIVVCPPIADLGPVVPLRRRLDPLADVIPPHITLVFPFRDDLSDADLLEHLKGASAGIAPFPLGLAGIRGWEGEYLFLSVDEGRREIVELHDRLYTGPLERHLSTSREFVPHMTVGRIGDKGKFEAALRVTTDAEPRVSTLVSALVVYRFSDDGPGTIVWDVTFG